MWIQSQGGVCRPFLRQGDNRKGPGFEMCIYITVVFTLTVSQTSQVSHFLHQNLRIRFFLDLTVGSNNKPSTRVLGTRVFLDASYMPGGAAPDMFVANTSVNESPVLGGVCLLRKQQVSLNQCLSSFCASITTFKSKAYPLLRVVSLLKEADSMASSMASATLPATASRILAVSLFWVMKSLHRPQPPLSPPHTHINTL